MKGILKKRPKASLESIDDDGGGGESVAKYSLSASKPPVKHAHISPPQVSHSKTSKTSNNNNTIAAPISPFSPKNNADNTIMAAKDGGVRWDEENIYLTGLERGTRQKIDEPKTPYIYGQSAETLNNGVDDSGGLLTTSSAIGLPQPPLIDLGTRMYDAFSRHPAAAVSGERSPLENELSSSNTAHTWDSSSGLEENSFGDSGADDDIDEEVKKRSFAAKRAQHYRIKEKLKRFECGDSSRSSDQSDTDMTDN